MDSVVWGERESLGELFHSVRAWGLGLVTVPTAASEDNSSEPCPVPAWDQHQGFLRGIGEMLQQR